MVSIGFPTRSSGDVPTLVHASRETKLLARIGYDCPRCQAKVSELPTSCPVCGLQLVVSPHLARSFHHLFPVPPFSEVQPLEEDKYSRERPSPPAITSMDVGSSAEMTKSAVIAGADADDKLTCYGCLSIITTEEDDNATTSSRNKKGKGSNDKKNNTTKETSLRFQCPQCKNVFCADCDAYLHETLHNCPGCLCN